MAILIFGKRRRIFSFKWNQVGCAQNRYIIQHNFSFLKKLIIIRVHQNGRQTGNLIVQRKWSQHNILRQLDGIDTTREQFDHVRVFSAGRLRKAIKLRLSCTFVSVFITSRLNILPKPASKFLCQAFHNQNHINIPCCSKIQTILAHQKVTCGSANNGVLFGILRKPLPKAFYSHDHILTISFLLIPPDIAGCVHPHLQPNSEPAIIHQPFPSD